MSSTCQPTNINLQTPFGSRFEMGFPTYEFGKQMFGKQLYEQQYGPCPPQPTMNTPFGGYPWSTLPMPHQQLPYLPYQQTPYFYGGYPSWTPVNYGPFQQQQWWGLEQQLNHQFCGYNQTYCNIPCRPSCQTEFYCLTNPIRVLPEGNRMLWLCFDCRGFKPEECNVTFNKTERCFTIECNQECKDGKEHHVQRKYFRKYCIPETIKCDLTKCEPKCYVNQDGQLTIECQLPKMTPEEQNKCPQITYPNWYGCPPTNCYTPVNCKSC